MVTSEMIRAQHTAETGAEFEDDELAATMGGCPPCSSWPWSSDSSMDAADADELAAAAADAMWSRPSFAAAPRSSRGRAEDDDDDDDDEVSDMSPPTEESDCSTAPGSGAARLLPPSESTSLADVELELEPLPDLECVGVDAALLPDCLRTLDPGLPPRPSVDALDAPA